MAGEDHWFEPKSYGYGAQPANWKGWAATGVFVAIMVALAWVFVMAPGEGGPQILTWLAIQTPVLVGFIWLAHWKTRGGWKWHWGDRK